MGLFDSVPPTETPQKYWKLKAAGKPIDPSTLARWGEQGKGLLNPMLPGTPEFAARVNAWKPPNPLTTKPSENTILGQAMGMAPAGVLKSVGKPIYYHYTSQSFPMSEFKTNPTRGAAYFGTDPETVAKGAWGGRGNAAAGNRHYKPGDNIIPVHVEGKIYGRDTHLPFEVPKVVKSQEEFDVIIDKINKWEPPGASNYYKSDVPRIKEEARKIMREMLDSYAEDPKTGHIVLSDKFVRHPSKNPPLWGGFEERTAAGSYVSDVNGNKINRMQAALKELGFDGAEVLDEAGKSVAVFNPSKTVKEYFQK